MNLIARTTLIVAAMLALCGAARAAEIVLNDSVEARYRFVKFSAVATVVGASEEETAGISDIFCGPAPEPGETRLVTVDYLKMRLRQSGFDPSRFKFGGAKAVTMKNVPVVEMLISADFDGCDEQTETSEAAAPAANTSLTEKIHAAILACAKEKLPAAESDLAVEICSVGKALLACGESAEVVSVKPAREIERPGKITFSVLARDGGRDVRSAVIVNISRFADVAVAAENIPADTVIEEGMIAVKRIPVSANMTEYFSSARDLVGLKTKAGIVTDQPVSGSSVEQPVMVKRNDIVKVIVKIAGTNNAVETNARAEQNGRRGELIKVTNINSGKTFLAEVTGPRQAEIVLGEK